MNKKLLFVCLGNICRSPAAEAICLKMATQLFGPGSITCDSAGTANYHVGDKADPRMIRIASERGYPITSIGRQLAIGDFQQFDTIFAMDKSNYKNILTLYQKSGVHQNTNQDIIKNITDYRKRFTYDEVPDPYYKDEQAFHTVIDILEDSIHNMLTTLFSK